MDFDDSPFQKLHEFDGDYGFFKCPTETSWRTFGSQWSFTIHCTIYKFYVAFDFALICLMCYQLYHYLVRMHAAFTDIRIVVWTLCVFFQFICFVYFGFVDPHWLTSGAAFQDLARNTIFVFICLYFVDRTKKMLPYDKTCIRYIQILYFISYIMYFLIGVAVLISQDTKSYCQSFLFNVFRWMSLLLIGVFAHTYMEVRKRIE
jgi:hypothetical protein